MVSKLDKSDFIVQCWVFVKFVNLRGRYIAEFDAKVYFMKKII